MSSAAMNLQSDRAERREPGVLSVISLVMASLALAACAQPDDVPAAASAAPPFAGPLPAPAPPAASTPEPVPVVGRGEATQPPALDVPAAAPLAPEPEAPLTPEEQTQLDALDGLVPSAEWHAPVAAGVSAVGVARAYLDWRARFVKSCDDGALYVLKNDYTGSEEVVSEGIGYGLLLSVGIGDRATFDGLASYYRDRRNGNGVMNWRYAVCGGQTGPGGASDADLDAAMALVLAESRWGGYAEEAQALAGAISDHETETCDSGEVVLQPGDGWGGCGETVNPSYFSPAYYRRFALLQPERSQRWSQLTTDTYEMLRGMQDQVGGLLPDWGFGDGRAEDGDRGQYGYEAVRAPWRIMLDLAWSDSDEPRAILQRMSQTIDAAGGLTALADSESFEDKRNSAFLGSLSLTGAAVGQDKLDGYVAEWAAYADVDDVWYYQATLRVLFLMAAGGFLPPSY